MTPALTPINVFDTSFLNSPHLELATHVMGIGDAFSAHQHYQVVPDGVPHGKEIKELGTRLHDLTYAVMAGDNSKKAERDLYHDKAVLATCLALNWAGMRYLRENNIELITNLGVEHKKKSQPRSTAPTVLIAPTKLDLRRSEKSGTFLLVIGKVVGAVSYIVQGCQGDPNDEAAWSREWQFSKIKGGVELTGLEPGKVYYIRVRAFGHAGYGPWSTYVHMMAT
ncbi:MAG TPA: fibronectin type III domain-containing protein [Geomonas sp.]|nr:fibronectin type III domain-containing protein [Geomonas sp.]